MSSRLELTRNNVRAGVWVTVCLVLALGVVIALTDVLSAATRSYDEYKVSFSVRDGVGNLQPGSAVRVGGLDAGRVNDLEAFAGPNGGFENILVHFKLESTYQLYTDAVVTVDGALIGSDAWLTISSLGTPGQAIPAGDPIDGADAPGMLVSMLGPEIADDATRIVDDVTNFSAFLKGFPDHYDEDFKPIVLDVKAFSGRFDGWGDQVDHVMTWSNDVTDDIDRALATGQAILDDGRDLVEHNRPQIDEIIDNAEVTSGHARNIAQQFDEETMDKVHAFLDTGNDALDKANEVMTAFRADYDRWAVDLGETFANASLTAQQLKLVMGDIGRNPWKVLYRPTTDELENELLFEAARSFALAAADLKASASTVDRVMTNHGDRLGANRGALERLQQGLATSLENYEKAQKQLYEVLVQEQVVRGPDAVPDLETLIGAPGARESLRMLLLEGVMNVEILEAMFRIGAASGVDAILLDRVSSSPLLEQSIRASMEVAHPVPWMPSADWQADIRRLRDEWGVDLVAAETGLGAVPVWDIPREPLQAIVFGSERHGLSQSTLRACSAICRIPIEDEPGRPLNTATEAKAACDELWGK